MPHMAHIYRVSFHNPTVPESEFRTRQVSALAPDLAQRLARRVLELDHTWQLHECQDLGAWNRQPITAD